LRAGDPRRAHRPPPRRRDRSRPRHRARRRAQGVGRMMHRSRRVVVAALVCAGVAVPALLFVAQYPQWWVWIAQDQVPRTWSQSVTVVVAGVVGLVAWFVSRAAGRRPRLGFALLALGFAALAFDERFAIHERVRDGVLAPRDVRLPGLTWVAPGD